MGNRDARGREKRKPKKKEIKPTSTPAKRAVEYKPASPPQQEQGAADPEKTS
jgi:hypothetical protein